MATYASVADLTTRAFAAWGVEATWTSDTSGQHPENQWLTLNTDKARSDLGWRDRLDLDTSIQWTMQWYRDVLSGADPAEVSRCQVDKFLSLSNDETATSIPFETALSDRC